MFNTITNLENVVNHYNYKIGAYIRLSREDDQDGESESIINQRNFLNNWAKENNYEFVDYYVDDGFTGTNFNRPSFQRLIKDIESGRINMVVTKDLSRLGRDYIGIGEYIERYFPIKKVRYVAVTDGIDTFGDAAGNEMAPFKAVFNDMYAKDISKKIRTALRTKQKMGLWVGGCPPMGYMVDPDNKNHLIPDPTEDYIIKKIFSLALEGKTPFQIKNILTEEKIPTRVMLKGNVDNRIQAKTSRIGIWSEKTIKNILKNQLYTGDMVQNRRKKINYKVKKVVNLPKDEWIIVENTHEPLVSKKDYETVQNLLPKNSIRPEKKNYNLLDGILYCYECKHKIGICNPRKSDGRVYTVCNYYRMNSKYNVCTSHGFNYEYLENRILSSIKEIISNFLDKQSLINKMGNIKISNPSEKISKELEQLKNQVEQKTEMLDQIYIDKLNKKINDEMFERIFQKMTKEIQDLKDSIKEIEKLLSANSSLEYKFNIKEMLEEFLNVENITRDMILQLIDKIEIHKDKQIDIYFSFKELNNF